MPWSASAVRARLSLNCKSQTHILRSVACWERHDGAEQSLRWLFQPPRGSCWGAAGSQGQSPWVRNPGSRTPAGSGTPAPEPRLGLEPRGSAPFLHVNPTEESTVTGMVGGRLPVWLPVWSVVIRTIIRTDRDGVRGSKAADTVVEHAGSQVSGQGVCVLMKASNHGVGMPPAKQFDDI